MKPPNAKVPAVAVRHLQPAMKQPTRPAHQFKHSASQVGQTAPGVVRPVAPPVYDPRVKSQVQMKAAQAGQPRAGSTPQRPVAPPAYRPQQTPKCLQPKAASKHQAAASMSKPAPVAPPVYRPQAVTGVAPSSSTASATPTKFPASHGIKRAEISTLTVRALQPKMAAASTNPHALPHAGRKTQPAPSVPVSIANANRPNAVVQPMLEGVVAFAAEHAVALAVTGVTALASYLYWGRGGNNGGGGGGGGGGGVGGGGDAALPDDDAPPALPLGGGAAAPPLAVAEVDAVQELTPHQRRIAIYDAARVRLTAVLAKFQAVDAWETMRDRIYDADEVPNSACTSTISLNLSNAKVYHNFEGYLPAGHAYTEYQVNVGIGAAGGYRLIVPAGGGAINGFRKWFTYSGTHGGAMWWRAWNGAKWMEWDVATRTGRNFTTPEGRVWPLQATPAPNEITVRRLDKLNGEEVALLRGGVRGSGNPYDPDGQSRPPINVPARCVR
jgi:hypothetical protein